MNNRKGLGPKRVPSFSRNLRQVRERMGIDQREFADFLDVTQQTISLWERGLRTPGRRTWTLLEQKLGYSKVDLESSTLPFLPESGVRETKTFARSIPLPPPKEGFPATHLALDGLAVEAVNLAKAQRLLREAVRAGKPIWIVVG